MKPATQVQPEPAGPPAATYDIRVGPRSAPHVRVGVWARGAAEDNGRPAFELVVELHNTGERDVRLDVEMLELDAFSPTGGKLPRAQLSQPDLFAPSVRVSPGTTSVIPIRFVLADGVAPTDLANIRLRWAIAHPDGQRYIQHTRFKQVVDAVAKTVMYYDPVWGYYDPFLYGAPFYGYHARYGVPIGRITHR